MKTIREMVSELVENGYSEPKLAALANTTQPSINRIKNGQIAEPSYAIGRAIETVYEEFISDRPAA